MEKLMLSLPRQVELYYIPVVINTYAAVLPKDLRHEKLYTVREEEWIKILFRSLEQVNKPSRFQDAGSRLLVEKTPSSPQYLMDNNGNVRRDKDKREYQLTPRAFYDLAILLELNIIERLRFGPHSG